MHGLAALPNIDELNHAQDLILEHKKRVNSVLDAAYELGGIENAPLSMMNDWYGGCTDMLALDSRVLLPMEDYYISLSKQAMTVFNGFSFNKELDDHTLELLGIHARNIAHLQNHLQILDDGDPIREQLATELTLENDAVAKLVATN